MKRFLSLLFILIVSLSGLMGCSQKSSPPVLSKCMNIGNSLDSPKGDNWGVPMDISYFKTIKDAGFSCVRLPVRFSDYVDSSSADYTLDSAFMTQIDSYVAAAQKNHLTLILDLHHFDAIMQDPMGNENLLLSIWKQLATRYKDEPDSLVFELLNEPQANMDATTWNTILSDTVKAIRKIDTKHYLIVGGVNYNSIDSLSDLKLPKDSKLIATFHYYEPNEVCFQGVPYQTNYENLSNIAWNGTVDEVNYLNTRLKTAKAWATKNHVPLFMGEFGISKAAPASTRLSWISSVCNEASSLNISYGYWELGSSFGIYDLSSKTWNQDLLNAIIHPTAD